MSAHRILLAGSAALVVAGGAWALTQQPQEQPTPEQMMEYFAKISAPGEEHRALAPIVGEFRASGTFWMDPSAPPITSEGRSVNTWTLGGRYVRMDYTGDFMDQPFTGVGYMGFDNITRRYQSTWMDSMSTAIMFMEGDMDAATRTLTWRSEMVDPMTGQKMKVRETLRIESPDRHVLEWFQAYPGAEEMKSMQIVYTRK